MDFQTYLKPLVVISKILGLFLVDSEEDHKQVPWIIPIFLIFTYCFYENRLANFSTIEGQYDMILFARDYGSAYSGFFAMIIVFGHNFVERKKIRRLVENLGDFEMKQFFFGVEKRHLGRKLVGFVALGVLNWATDAISVRREYGAFNNFAYMGYALPVYLHYCCAFFHKELLSFTRKNFKEINLRLIKLGNFDANQVIRLSEAHFQLLQISRDENSLFSIPILVQLAHIFCMNIVLYGMTLKSIFAGTAFTMQLVSNVNAFKWCFLLLGTVWYVVRIWTLVTQEVSQNNIFARVVENFPEISILTTLIYKNLEFFDQLKNCF